MYQVNAYSNKMSSEYVSYLRNLPIKSKIFQSYVLKMLQLDIDLQYVLLVLININFHYLLQLLGVYTIFADIILQTFLAISSCLRLSGAVVPTPYKCVYKCPSS